MFWKKSPSAVLASLLAIHLLAHIDRNILLGFSPQIIGDLGLSNAQYGFLVGAVWVLRFGTMADGIHGNVGGPVQPYPHYRGRCL